MDIVDMQPVGSCSTWAHAGSNAKLRVRVLTSPPFASVRQVVLRTSRAVPQTGVCTVPGAREREFVPQT
jgi:hypothetical protein